MGLDYEIITAAEADSQGIDDGIAVCQEEFYFIILGADELIGLDLFGFAHFENKDMWLNKNINLMNDVRSVFSC